MPSTGFRTGSYPIVWPGNLLGALVLVPIVAVLALSVRQYWLALAVVVAGVAKLVSERIVKAVVTRERPATSIGSDVETRGDVSVSGESFVSGHAISLRRWPRSWRRTSRRVAASHSGWSSCSSCSPGSMSAPTTRST